jgi:hypothetical protein
MSVSIKKSQIFIFDLIFSVVILIVTMGVIFSYFIKPESNSNIYNLDVKIVNDFTTTKVNDLNDLVVRDYFIEGKIKNIHNTVANQVAEFYYTGDIDYAENLTKLFISSYIDKTYNYQVLLYNGSSNIVLYEYKVNPDAPSFNNARISAQVSREIMGFLDLNHYYGPYNFIVRIWY